MLRVIVQVSMNVVVNLVSNRLPESELSYPKLRQIFTGNGSLFSAKPLVAR
jgi:hypothetical protein